jgi:hypothetical protein
VTDKGYHSAKRVLVQAAALSRPGQGAMCRMRGSDQARVAESARVKKSRPLETMRSDTGW